MSKKKIAAMMVSLGLVAAIGAGATFAYLTKTTDQLTNTFTVGDGIDIGLYETKWDGSHNGGHAENKTLASTEFTGNKYTDLMPGDSVYKDPSVQVEPSSDCYLFVKLEGIDSLINPTEDASWKQKDFTVSGLDSNTDWVKVKDISGDGNTTELKDGYYVYQGTKAESNVIKAQETAFMTGNLFNTIEYNATADGRAANITSITVKACAVQAANFANADAALKEAIWS